MGEFRDVSQMLIDRGYQGSRRAELLEKYAESQGFLPGDLRWKKFHEGVKRRSQTARRRQRDIKYEVVA